MDGDGADGGGEDDGDLPGKAVKNGRRRQRNDEDDRWIPEGRVGWGGVGWGGRQVKVGGI